MPERRWSPRRRRVQAIILSLNNSNNNSSSRTNGRSSTSSDVFFVCLHKFPAYDCRHTTPPITSIHFWGGHVCCFNLFFQILFLYVPSLMITFLGLGGTSAILDHGIDLSSQLSTFSISYPLSGFLPYPAFPHDKS